MGEATRHAGVKKIVIADAGPLIALARIGQLEWLAQLFGTVTLTDLVALEITGGSIFPDTEALAKTLTQPWLETVTLSESSLEACRDWVNLHQIDVGEASALVLASQLIAQGDEVLVIVDETRGRQAAEHAAITITGTAGLLLLAKRCGLLPTVKPLLIALQAQSYYLSDRLLEAVLRQAGEA